LALAFALVHGALVAPWLWRMHRLQAGWLMTEAKQGLNVDFLRNGPGQDPDSWEAGRHVELPPEFEALPPSERNGLLLKIALERVWREPGLYLQNCLYRAGRLLAPVAHYHDASPRENLVLALATVLFLYVPWGLVLLGLVRGRAPDRGDGVLLVAVILWYLFHSATVGSVRFRLPSDVWVAALAFSLWQRRCRPSLAGSGTAGAGPTAGQPTPL
jgi:hypothetical protein